MKIVKGLLVIILLLVIVGIVLPDRTHVERSAVINAPQAEVFDYLNDFRKFNLWSPWRAKDPNTQYQFSGPATGVGSKISWQSDNSEVGTGSQEITVSQANDYLETILDFGSHGTAKAHYRLSTVDGLTQITWGFDSEHGWNLLSRYFGLMMEGMLGPEYEKGLANLKKVVESQEQEAGQH